MASKASNSNHDTKKRKKLSKADVECPICLGILIEPVTMPCKHELCLTCFKENITETSLTCPMCRQRVSNWARSRVKTNSLVNLERWQEIKEAFPRKVMKRLEGKEYDSSDEDEDSTDEFIVIPNISEPGEIGKEFEEILQKFDNERRKRQEEEEAASRDLITRLQQREEEDRLAKERLALSDEALAKALEQAQTDADKTLTSPELSAVINRKTNSQNPNVNSSKKTPSTLLDRYLARGATKIDRSGQPKSNGDGYPYRCLSPWEKEEKKPAASTAQRPPSTGSDIFATNSESNSTVSYVFVDSKDNSRNPSTRTTPVADETAIASQLEVSGNSRPASETSSRDAAETLLVAMFTGDDEGGGKDAKRSSSAISSDSITQELNHFKPIRTCPKTPPRRLPSGQLMEISVVRSTPRSLSGMASPGTSDPETSKQQTTISSPIMKKRLEVLAKERKSQVESLSKGTDTRNVFGSTMAHLEHSYSSPSRVNTVTKTTANSTVSMRELCRKSAVSTITSSSVIPTSTLNYDMYTSSRRLHFDDTSFNEDDNIHPDPMPLLPLEPNLDDDEDDSFFNPMPELQKFDGGDTSENPSSQIRIHPPNLLTSDGDRQRCSKQERRDSPVIDSKTGHKTKSFSNSKTKQAVTPKISKHFRKIESKSLNKCTSDLVGVTDRLKDDTGSPNQPHTEAEVRNATKSQTVSQDVRTKECNKSQSIFDVSPKKRLKAMKSKPSPQNTGKIKDSCAADVASLTNRKIIAESCSDKVERWLEKHRDNDASNSTQSCNDTNNNSPKKAKQQLETETSCSESPTKGTSRKSHRRHKPKMFSAEEGYSILASPGKRQCAPERESGIESDKLEVRDSRDVKKSGNITESETEVAGNQSDANTLSPSKSPRVKPGIRKEVKGHSSQASIDKKVMTSATEDDLSVTGNSPLKKRKRGRPRKIRSNLSECASVTESECEDPKLNLHLSTSHEETESVLESAKNVETLPQKRTKKRKQILSISELSECDSDGKPPKHPSAARKRQKKRQTKQEGADVFLEDTDTSDFKSTATPRKRRIPDLAQEYTPTDNGKKMCGKFDDAQKKGTKWGTKKSVTGGQQRVDDLFNSMNSKAEERSSVITEAAETMSDSVSAVSELEPPDRSQFASDELYKEHMEEYDRRFAENLHRTFELQDKYKLNTIRFKGSQDEYALRRRKATCKSVEGETSEAPATRQRRSRRK